MIEVRCEPVVKATQRGWELVFWMGEAFDYETPFRAALNEIAETLGCDIRLPAYEKSEDFIEGTLHIGVQVLSVYYEHSLGYLSISSDSAEALRQIAHRLQSNLKVEERLGRDPAAGP